MENILGKPVRSSIKNLSWPVNFTEKGTESLGTLLLKLASEYTTYFE
jgi:hypothetical protein